MESFSYDSVNPIKKARGMIMTTSQYKNWKSPGSELTVYKSVVLKNYIIEYSAINLKHEKEVTKADLPSFNSLITSNLL